MARLCDARSPHELSYELSRGLASLAAGGRTGDVEGDLRTALDLVEGGAASEESAVGEEAREAIVASLTYDLPGLLLAHLDLLSFEARKHAMHLFAAVLKGGLMLDLGPEVVAYIWGHQEIAQLLLRGYGREEVAHHYGYMLRACTRYPELVAFLLDMSTAFELVNLVKHGSFDVTSDAFASIRALLLTHEETSAAYLETHFDAFFDLYNGLLLSEDYVTQRQALQLLGDMLLSKCFVAIMFRYVTNVQYLQIIMRLLRHRSKHIPVGAFHIFKIFVGNPSKPPQVRRILCKNREKILLLLDGFSSLRESDENFVQDLHSVAQLLEGPLLSRPQRLATSLKNAPGTLAVGFVH
jgi:hypothetical protein